MRLLARLLTWLLLLAASKVVGAEQSGTWVGVCWPRLHHRVDLHQLVDGDVFPCVVVGLRHLFGRPESTGVG